MDKHIWPWEFSHSNVIMDKIDLHIIKLVQENSKLTNLELSKKIGLSPAPTLERVKKLEKSGIIESYHAKRSSKKLGLNVKAFVLVSLELKEYRDLNHLVAEIEAIPEIVECYNITGASDLMLKIIASDMEAYEELIFMKLSRIAEINRIQTMIVLSTFKDSDVLPFNYSAS